ncbi:UNVERIFIED_CONTAM: hypothetical protein Sindi_2705400 [Sesamum indicum]
MQSTEGRNLKFKAKKQLHSYTKISRQDSAVEFTDMLGKNLATDQCLSSTACGHDDNDDHEAMFTPPPVPSPVAAESSPLPGPGRRVDGFKPTGHSPGIGHAL